MKTRILFLTLVIVIVWTACSTDDAPLQTVYLDLPSAPYNYNMGQSDDLPTLGRVLFYDRQLSVNNSISCASCHKQELAFADNVAFSKGFDDKPTLRNSMPIQNITATTFFPDSGAVKPNPRPGFPDFFINFTELFWDGRERSLPRMVLRPIVNHVEMGVRDLDALNGKIASIPYYNDLFTKAFGSSEVTSEKIGRALSAFLISITSRRTEFDKAMTQERDLTALESEGQHLFFTTYDCNQCHQLQSPDGYVFAGTFANVGLDAAPEDKGLGAVTGMPSDNGRFKIPSLRNVALTAPYMHDGRFSTLSEVLDHYSEGIEDDENLDPRLKDSNGAPVRMHIPESDKKAIIAFLQTMTDREMITDVRFSNPFKSK
jgi:cytochrome c peroxidase